MNEVKLLKLLLEVWNRETSADEALDIITDMVDDEVTEHIRRSKDV